MFQAGLLEAVRLIRVQSYMSEFPGIVYDRLGYKGRKDWEICSLLISEANHRLPATPDAC